MTQRFTHNAAKIVAFTAGLICFLVYMRALSCGFVNFDDQEYVLNNVAIRKINTEFLIWALTTSYIDWWIPFTWISFAIDYFFWGLNPQGYHLTNILLHSLNTGIVVLIADRLLRQQASGEHGYDADDKYVYPAMLLCAALMWGVHPLRVEAVVWVTARKDVLNGVFSLSALLMYIVYVQHREFTGKKQNYIKYYWISLLLFIGSLLAKPSSVILPLVLMIADWYPFERFRKDHLIKVLFEKIPFFVASCVMSVATVLSAAQNNNVASVITLGQKFVISGNAVFEYIKLMLLPIGIIPLYFIPAPIPYAYTVKTALIILLFVAVLVCHKYKAVCATWLYFVASLLPVIGFVQVGTQAFAARFSYLPSMVPSIAAAVMIFLIYDKLKTYGHQYLRLTVLILLCCSLLVVYVAITEKLIDTWRDSGRLWSRQIAYLPFDRAFFYRGLFYVDNGKPETAIADYSACLKILESEENPESFNLYAFRGEAFVKAGRYTEAVIDFDYAIAKYPHPLYFYHRGTALYALGKLREAENDFVKAGRARGQMYWFNSQMSEYRLPKPNANLKNIRDY